MLVGRKEERQEINRLAAARLTPPPGFADLYHDSDKYTGLLPVVARGRKDKFTLMLMQAPGLSVKDTSEVSAIYSILVRKYFSWVCEMDVRKNLKLIVSIWIFF